MSAQNANWDGVPVNMKRITKFTGAGVVLLIIAVVVRERYPLFSFALLFYLVAHSLESTVLPLEMVFEQANQDESEGE